MFGYTPYTMTAVTVVGSLGTALFCRPKYRRKAALRAADAVSFLLGGVSIIVTAISFGNFDQEHENYQSKIRAAQITADFIQAVVAEVEQACPSPPSQGKVLTESEMKSYVESECGRLHDYTMKVVLAWDLPNFTTVKAFPPVPSSRDFKDARIRYFAEELDKQVTVYNQAVARIQFSDAILKLEQYSHPKKITLFIAAHVFAFAFGIGVVRRAFAFLGSE